MDFGQNALNFLDIFSGALRSTRVGQCTVGQRGGTGMVMARKIMLGVLLALPYQVAQSGGKKVKSKKYLLLKVCIAV